MLSYPRKSAQRYELIIKFTINDLNIFHIGSSGDFLRTLKKVLQKFCQKTQKKFAGLKIMSTFAIPKQTKRWW